MRRFVVEMDNGSLVGVECDDYSWGMHGLQFHNRMVTDRGNLSHYYIVLGCAPGTFRLFREIHGDDWPQCVVGIHTQDGWGHYWGAL